MVGPPPHTAALLQLCEESAWNPNLDALRECVQLGADVTAYAECAVGRVPILSPLILAGRVEAVKACLKSPRPVNFTRTDERGYSVLHCCAVAFTGSIDYNVDVTRAVVDRLSRHPLDVADWGQREETGMDFLSLAAEHQRLSVLWPEVKHVPYFADPTERFSLKGSVWAWDWDALGAASQKLFEDEHCMTCRNDELQGFYLKSAVVSQFIQVALQQPVHLDALRESINAINQQYRVFSAEMDAGAPLKKYSANWEVLIALNRFLSRGLVEPTMMLLNEWEPRIDFTCRHFTAARVDPFGWTPLHYTFIAGGQHWSGLRSELPLYEGGGKSVIGMKSPRVVSELLGLVLQRIQKQESSSGEGRNEKVSSVDWAIKDFNGDNLFSLAGLHGHLSTVLHVICDEFQVPYFTKGAKHGAEEAGETDVAEEHASVWDLSLPVPQADWEFIPEADQKRFRLHRPLCDGGWWS